MELGARVRAVPGARQREVAPHERDEVLGDDEPEARALLAQGRLIRDGARVLVAGRRDELGEDGLLVDRVDAWRRGVNEKSSFISLGKGALFEYILEASDEHRRAGRRRSRCRGPRSGSGARRDATGRL